MSGASGSFISSMFVYVKTIEFPNRYPSQSQTAARGEKLKSKQEWLSVQRIEVLV